MAGAAYWEPGESADAGSAQEVDEADTEVLRQQQQRARLRQDMLSRLRLCSHCPRQHDVERRLRGAKQVAKLLRKRATLPAEMEQQGNWQDEAVRLPRVSCAFRTCPGMQYVEEARVGEDETLRDHILAERGQEIMQAIAGEHEEENIYDIYREALAVQERKGVPAVGAAVDRRAFDATLAVFNDQSIQALICMCCARICVQTAGPQSSIDYQTGKWLLSLPAGR